MNDTILDLRRELEKARITLIDTQTHLAHHAEANAALHCSTTVMYSPLHAKVTAAIQQIEHALDRTVNAITHVKASEDDAALAAVLLDLDRCVHGRHSQDECGSCDHGHSAGNHHLPPGRVIGYWRHGTIVVPEPADRHTADAWRRRDYR